MSPVSRGRKPKSKKKAARRARRPELPPLERESPDDAALPDGEPHGEGLAPVDLNEVLDTVVDDPDLPKIDDPLTAELLGAGLVDLAEEIVYHDAEADPPALDELVAGIEDRAGPAAVLLLLAVGAVLGGPSGRAAVAAADRLVALGHPRPRWADELGEPVAITDCRRLAGDPRLPSAMAAVFRRANRSHATVVLVDGAEQGAALEVLPADPEKIDEMLVTLREALDIPVEPVRLEPAEFRRRAVAALDARAEIDRAHGLLGNVDPFADLDQGPSYPMMARLLRSRLATLPSSGG